MGKRILIGSMLVLAMLLLMPSIPAIQQRTIEDKAYNGFKEKLDEINLDALRDIELLDGIKHPILYVLFIAIAYFQSYRLVFYTMLMLISIEINQDYFGSFDIIHPILFLISIIRLPCLVGTTIAWKSFWYFISITLGWNWDIPFP